MLRFKKRNTYQHTLFYQFDYNCRRLLWQQALEATFLCKKCQLHHVFMVTLKKKDVHVNN